MVKSTLTPSALKPELWVLNPKSSAIRRLRSEGSGSRHGLGFRVLGFRLFGGIGFRQRGSSGCGRAAIALYGYTQSYLLNLNPKP